MTWVFQAGSTIVIPPIDPVRVEYRKDAIVSTYDIPASEPFILLLAKDVPALSIDLLIYEHGKTRDELYTQYLLPILSLHCKTVTITSTNPYSGNWILASISYNELPWGYFEVKMEFKRGDIMVSLFD